MQGIVMYSPLTIVILALLEIAAPRSAMADAAATSPDIPAITAAPIIVTGHGLQDSPATPAYDVQTLGRDALTASVSDRIEDVLSDVAGFQQYRPSDSRSHKPSPQ